MATVKGLDNWSTMRDTIAGHDVKGALFHISPDRTPSQPLRLQEFKLEATSPYVYDRFVGAWGMFPHHD